MSVEGVGGGGGMWKEKETRRAICVMTERE